MAASHRNHIVILGLVLLAIAVRMVNLGGDSLWLDEAATVIVAEEDLGVLLAGDAVASHPPGYYLIIRQVLEFSDSEAAIRAPSAIASALTVLTVYMLTRRLFGPAIALLASLVLIFSPLDVWYAQEARQPAFASLAIFLGVYGLVRQDILGRVIAILALAAGLYVDFIVAGGWLAVGAAWCYWWWKRDRLQVRWWILVTGAAAVIIAPIPGWRFSEGVSHLFEYARVWYGDVFGSDQVTSSSLGILAFVFAISLMAAWIAGRLLRGSRREIWGLLALGAFAIFTIATPIPRAFSVKKVLVVGWPLIAIAIAVILYEVIKPRLRLSVGSFIIAISVAAVVFVYLLPKDDWRSAVAHVNATAAENDIAWVSDEPWADNAYRYYNGRLPVFNEVSAEGLDLATGRVWLITKRRSQDPIPSITAEAWFDQNWTFLDERPFYRLAVRVYRPPIAN